MEYEFEPRAYRAQLYRWRTEVRLDGAAYLVDLDLRPNRTGLDISYGRLNEMFRRLTKLDGANPRELDTYQLKLTQLYDDVEPVWWVPTRPEGEDTRWV